MKQFAFFPRLRDIFLGVGLLWAASGMLRCPRESMDAVYQGLSLCGRVIIPSLFPFFVLSSLMVELGLSRYADKLLAPVMGPLFRLNGACAGALVLGLIGGYPLGARTAISLYQNGQCTKAQAEGLLAFCNNCGPAFVLGVVGMGAFGSPEVGLLLYLTHACGAVAVGLLFRLRVRSENLSSAGTNCTLHAAPFAPAFTHSVTGALTSTLNVCAFVLFFTVVLRWLFLSGVLPALANVLATVLHGVGMTQPRAQILLTGFLEVSSGVSALSLLTSPTDRMVIAAFILGWGGLSVHCQALAFSGESGLSMRPYLTGKFLHGVVSALLTGIYLTRTSMGRGITACLGAQTGTTVSIVPSVVSILPIWSAWLLFFAAIALMLKKSSRNDGRYGL